MGKLNPKNYMEGHSIDELETNTNDLLVFFENVPYDSGLVETVLDYFNGKRVNVDILTQTAPVGGHTENAFIIGKEHLREAQEVCDVVAELYPEVDSIINDHIARLSLSGIGMRTQSGVAARFLSVLSECSIPIYVITTSEIRIAAVIDASDLKRARKAVADSFGIENHE